MPIETPMTGRWDMVVHHPDGDFPSWFELDREGAGRFVGQFGSVRPIKTIHAETDALKFGLPPQYEPRTDDMVFSGILIDGALKGATTHFDGTPMSWNATRAPELPKLDVVWGNPRSLIGTSFEDWRPRSPNQEFNWSISEGMLVNSKVGSDLVLKASHRDFRLICEYKYPPGSNSGIYLRGRYEVQILDDFGKESTWGSSGAIYGFIVPTVNAIKPANEWNLCEIELIGRWVTITLNGTKIVDQQEIPGITGGALDSNEGDPGSLFLQGDHGPVTFRRLDLSEPRS
jgi:hypothetical protein